MSLLVDPDVAGMEIVQVDAKDDQASKEPSEFARDPPGRTRPGHLSGEETIEILTGHVLEDELPGARPSSHGQGSGDRQAAGP